MGPGLRLGLDDKSWLSWLSIVMRTSTKSVSARRQQTGLGIGVETHFYSGLELRDMPGGLGSTQASTLERLLK